MNEGIERAMNSENLGTRIMQNRALDQKISDLESCRGKMVCLGGSGAILKKWSGWRVLAQKTGLLRNVRIFRGFLWIFRSGLGPICN
jgi:hypothetical protein